MDAATWEIRAGGARAVVMEHGATLRAFDVDGVAYLETFDDTPPLGAGAVLIPWPNRVAGATWTRGGDTRSLEVTEPARGNASHGLVRKAPWAVEDKTEARLTLAITVDGRPGWPYTFRTTATYAVQPDGLTVTYAITNQGSDTMPFGVGAHPYPRPGATAMADAVLRLAATTHLPLDPERMVPSGPAAPIEGLDFRRGEPVAALNLDDAFGGCEPGPDGLVRHSLTGPSGGVDLWADPVFRWVQVFTPGAFPGRPGPAVAVEPMTCPPDALNSGVDLLEVAPGDTWTASWGLTARPGIGSAP